MRFLGGGRPGDGGQRSACGVQDFEASSSWAAAASEPGRLSVITSGGMSKQTSETIPLLKASQYYQGDLSQEVLELILRGLAGYVVAFASARVLAWE